MPRALITGITGQDGLYLSEFLLSKGYEVFGLIRGQSNPKLDLVRQTVPQGYMTERGGIRFRQCTKSAASGRPR